MISRSDLFLIGISENRPRPLHCLVNAFWVQGWLENIIQAESLKRRSEALCLLHSTYNYSFTTVCSMYCPGRNLGATLLTSSLLSFFKILIRYMLKHPNRCRLPYPILFEYANEYAKTSHCSIEKTNLEWNLCRDNTLTIERLLRTRRWLITLGFL